MEKSIILTNDISEINKLSEFVEEIGNELSLAPDVVFNLNLVLEEAVVNIINYAYPKEEHQSIYLSATLHEGSIILVLTDTGVEFDPTMAPEADITLSAEERPIGGLGIFLIRQIMNEVRYDRIDGKNVLTMEKKL
jgi:serine/threonine-protein kinase RsbW